MTWTGETKHTTSYKNIPKWGSGILQQIMTQNQSYYTQQQQSFGSATWTEETKHTTDWTAQSKN